VAQRRARLRTRGALTEQARSGSVYQRTWTEAEDALIAATLDHPVDEVIVHFPARTAEAVKLRRRALAAREVVDGTISLTSPAPRQWTDEEDAVIRAMGRNTPEVARQLGRSINAVAKRRTVLRDRDGR
jgi:hypothetical protein